MDVLRPLALGGEQAHPDVEAAPLVLELAHPLAADGGVHGVPDGGHADPEVGGLVPVGNDLDLGHAHLVVAVQVGHQAGLADLVHDLPGRAGQELPVAAPDVELDREAPGRAEAHLGDVLE